VVFVSSGASGNNEHNVLDLSGATSESTFESSLSASTAGGTFNR
jgi:hypothetical protein